MLRYGAKLLQCLRQLRYEPNDPDAMFTLGVIYAAEGHPGKAVRFLQKVQRIQASYPGLGRLMRKVLALMPHRA